MLTTLETSGEDPNQSKNEFVQPALYLLNNKFLPKTVYDRQNYTRNEWRRSKTTLETSGEDVKITLETSGEDVKIHSKRVEKM